MTKKILVMYYSLEGSTKLIAETIAKELDADSMECVPEQDIQNTGFMKYVRGGRQAISKKQPVLKPFSKNVDDYDAIIIGTPVRAFTYAPAIRSFFATTTLTGKKVAVFCTHEGGMGKTILQMKEQLKDDICIGEADFVKVKKNREENIEKAKKRAKNIIEVMG